MGKKKETATFEYTPPPPPSRRRYRPFPTLFFPTPLSPSYYIKLPGRCCVGVHVPFKFAAHRGQTLKLPVLMNASYTGYLGPLKKIKINITHSHRTLYFLILLMVWPDSPPPSDVGVFIRNQYEGLEGHRISKRWGQLDSLPRFYYSALTGPVSSHFLYLPVSIGRVGFYIFF